MGSPRQRFSSLASIGVGAWLLSFTATACQLIAGIGSDELVPPDAGERSDGTVHHMDGGHDAHEPIRDAARIDAREAGKPDTGYDSQPTGTPCQVADVCIPESTFLGPEGMQNAYCGAEAGAVTCGNGAGAACCPGNPNGHGSSGGFCPGSQAICTGATCMMCGNNDNPCCVAAGDGGEACPSGANLVCEPSGTCSPCGQLEEACCLSKKGGFLCSGGGQPMGAVCDGVGRCVQCNGACASGCCDPVHGCVEAGATCTNGLTCKMLSCDLEAVAPMCGVAGAPCCGGLVCRDGSLCSAGACVRCGGPGGPCCPSGGGKACAPGNVCDNTGASCVPCGSPGQTCCPGDTCAVGTCNPVTNTCDPGLGCGAHCGGVGQGCCPSTFSDPTTGLTSIVGTCAPAMCCDNTVDAGVDADGVCRLQGSACSNGFVCGDGGCQPCGTMGVGCCAGGRCGDGGLTCTDEGICM